MNSSKKRDSQVARAIPIDARQIRTSCACAETCTLVVRGTLVCAICRAPFVTSTDRARPFSQHDLPPGTKRRKFLAIAAQLRAAGDAGSWREGRSVLVDAAAWARGLELVGQGRPVAPTAPRSGTTLDQDTEALEVLGLARRAS